MADSKDDQAKPLAPLSLTTRSDQYIEDHYRHDQTNHIHSRTRLILCCGFVASVTLLIAVTFIVLSLTVYQFHNPNLTVNSISNRNTRVSVEISLRNSNAASFRVKNVTVLLYYGELVVAGDTSRRNETIPAKRTFKMNVTAEIVTTKLLASVPGLMEDLNGTEVDLRSSIEVIGKVKIFKIFKKSVHLMSNCSVKMMMMNKSSKLTFHCSKTRNGHEHI